MRFYRLLLRLYPSSFSVEYEDELAAVFAERTKNMSRWWFAFAALADVVPNAIAAHWELLVQDLRYAARSLSRARGFTATAIIVVALGVGANTAAFSLADFVLVRPLPFKESDRIVKIWTSTPDGGRNQLSPANFRDFAVQSRSFEDFGAFTNTAANLVGMGEPRRLVTIRATPNLLPLIGVPALLGRHFTEREATTGNPVLISYAVWQSQFGGDANVIGRNVRLDGVPHVIIGVMPASFHFPYRGIEAWTPLILREDDMQDRTDTYLDGVARLRDGVSLEQASEEMSVIAARLEKQFPDENKGIGAIVQRMRDEVSERSRMLVLALCGAALCILLLSCANLASLFLARGTHRARELAVRSALGAGRDRLVRQLITESFAITIIGGIVGVLVAMATVPLLARLVPGSLPIAQIPTVDLRVLAVAAAFVLITGLAFGVLPAIRAGRATDLQALHAGARNGGGRTQRLRSVLVVIEIVASVVLLVGSGLLIRVAWKLQNIDPGFRAENVLTMRTALPLPKYEKVATRHQFYAGVLEQVRALPGVSSAAYVTGLPLQMRGGIWTVSIDGVEPPPDGSHNVGLRYVTPQFFSTLGIPLRRGRDVSEVDTQDHPYVAVVSESFARRHFPSQDPIGKRIKVVFFDRTIVGVVGDVHVRGLERTSEPQLYLPYQQVPDGDIIGYLPKALVVRRNANPEALIQPIRRIVQSIDPEQPVSDINTLSAIVTDETASRVTQLRLLGAMALIALLIAAIGIHGLLTYTVSRRLPELGVRVALGAQVKTIVGLVMREGLVLASIGITIGAIVSYVAARGMGALLVGISAEDPITFLAACALCFVTVLVGCLRPALRAANVDPMTALRAE
ncbi:MAG TPA: ABC transporter permease [Thermoanaerobaculia bacterium]|jgi:putative ABC transport system permease protein|nr:ABC transporter permease [Thermoanaerobaculia bacterium]